MPDPISGTIGALGVGSGIFGAKKAADAQKSAAGGMQNAAIWQDTKLNELYSQALRNQDPYLRAGTSGLGQMANFDWEQGLPQYPGAEKWAGELPSFDAEYMAKLKDYEQSPAFLAQNALGQQDLARARSARGLDFGAPASMSNASAELSQRLRATDYDKYRQDLANRYGSLLSNYGQKYQEFKDRYSMDKDTYNQRLGLNQLKYGNLMNLAQMGQTAAGQQNALAQNRMSGVSGVSSGLQNAAQQQGQADAGFWSGLGGAIPGAISMGSNLKGLGLGSMFSGSTNIGGQGSTGANTGVPFQTASPFGSMWTGGQ